MPSALTGEQEGYSKETGARTPRKDLPCLADEHHIHMPPTTAQIVEHNECINLDPENRYQINFIT